jgi:hypothetical protein
MRLSLLALFFAAAACSSTGTSSSETPTFTAAEVRPSIEGTWNGTAVQAGTSKPVKLTLTYAPTAASTKCSNRTLSAGELDLACVDVSTVNLTASLVRETVTTSMSGSLLVTDLKYQNRGDLSLQAGVGTGATSDRLSARLDQGKLTGSLNLADGTSLELTLSR